jgi:hypothetical protein
MYASVVQHTQINKCNTPQQKKQRQNHLIISMDEEKAFDKILHHFMIKALRKLEIEGKYLNIIKAIYEKRTVRIILKDVKQKPFPLKS